MLTCFLVCVLALAIVLAYYITFKRPRVSSDDEYVATKIANIRSKKVMMENAKDGIIAIELDKKREAEINSLLIYLERYKLKNVAVNEDFEVIELSNYRLRQKSSC